MVGKCMCNGLQPSESDKEHEDGGQTNSREWQLPKLDLAKGETLHSALY